MLKFEKFCWFLCEASCAATIILAIFIVLFR